MPFLDDSKRLVLMDDWNAILDPKDVDSSTSAKVGSYLDRVLVRRADSDFFNSLTFHLIAWTDH